jgi:hypothetical protein
LYTVAGELPVPDAGFTVNPALVYNLLLSGQVLILFIIVIWFILIRDLLFSYFQPFNRVVRNASCSHIHFFSTFNH